MKPESQPQIQARLLDYQSDFDNTTVQVLEPAPAQPVEQYIVEPIVATPAVADGQPSIANSNRLQRLLRNYLIVRIIITLLVLLAIVIGPVIIYYSVYKQTNLPVPEYGGKILSVAVDSQPLDETTNFFCVYQNIGNVNAYFSIKVMSTDHVLFDESYQYLLVGQSYNSTLKVSGSEQQQNQESLYEVNLYVYLDSDYYYQDEYLVDFKVVEVVN